MGSSCPVAGSQALVPLLEACRCWTTPNTLVPGPMPCHLSASRQALHALTVVQACAEQGSSGCSAVVTTPQETAEVEEAEAEEAEPEEVKALRPYHETQRVNPRVEPRSLSWE